MTLPYEMLEGSADDMLLLCDHASNKVPAGIDLEIDPKLLDLHIGVDIGAGNLTRALAAALSSPAILATVSRLAIDLHREPDHPGLIPVESDGHPIAGNVRPNRDARIAAFYAPYHRFIARQVRAQAPKLILSLHSFTPRLERNGTDRPWEVGILYNRDARAAAQAIAWLREEGVVTGDNEPYSGRVLNATLNRHAEARGIPSIAIEVRNDLIGNENGVVRWAGILSRLAKSLRNSLA